MSDNPKETKINEETENDTAIESLLNKDANKSPLILKLAFIAIVGIGMSIFHLYTSGFGILEAWQQRSITFSFVLLLVPFLFPFKKGPKSVRRLIDAAFFLFSLATVSYIIFGYPEITLRESNPNTFDIIFGSLTVLLVLEATRRTIGLTMTLLVSVFIGYVFYGQHVPGILGHPGFDLEKAIDTYFNTTFGVFGLILGAMSNYIIVFIIFGAFLTKSQAGKFFIDLAFSLTGSRTGGPAKVAVLASGLMGSISGAAVSNVATTGTLTIPLMKRVGYKPHFAGGVEASASAGGQLMPPIMGAAAFIIAANLKIPYIELALFALIPALLHYFAVYMMVHFEASKQNLQGVPKSELPDIRKVLVEGWFLLLPIALIIFLLIKGFSPQYAGFYSTLSIVVVSLIRKRTRMSLKDIVGALELGGRNSVSIAVICAAAGILIASVNLTGLGLKFSSVVLELTGGSLLLTLIFIMIASILLGMGMPTVSAYVILSVLGVPALVQLGVLPIAAHLFVLYFAIMSNVTPPVAVAAYTAAAIAKADPNRTGFAGLKICLGTFIIPYMFIFGPELLMQGEPSMVILSIATAIVGIFSLTTSIQGWMLNRMNLIERLINLTSALLLIHSGWFTDIIGAFLLTGVTVYQFKKRKEINENNPQNSYDQVASSYYK